MEDRIVQLYEDVLHHRRHAFPPYFFYGGEGMRRAATMVRYVVEEKKKWNREQICLEISHDLFVEFRLAGMLKTYFKGSVLEALENAYPNEFQPWEMVRARRHIFSGPAGRETARRAVRWMVCERLSHVESTLEKLR
ncbi:hypothetical protein JZ785_03115 [Alicyclobacillus curvatus]|nr:hypothetical protein JZ785_03115 [Alicyclobacillus curvatus]